MNGKNIVVGKLFFVALALLSLMPFSASAENKLIVKGSDGITNNFTVDNLGTVTSMGRAGIGTSTPSAGLHLKGSVFPNNCLMAEGTEVTGGAGYLGYIVRSDGSLPKNNDRLGFLLLGTTTGTASYHAAGFQAYTDADWSSTSTPAYFSFLTTSAGSTGRGERLRITSAGNTQIFGGIQMSKNAYSPAKSTCNAAVRGTIWYAEGAAGAADVVNICAKDAFENYAWKVLPLQ
jgi:hypothetical protein